MIFYYVYGIVYIIVFLLLIGIAFSLYDFYLKSYISIGLYFFIDVYVESVFYVWC